MALVKKTQRSFSGGMLDKDLMGRQDLAKYSQGALVLENFKVRKQGNIIKRSGTDLVCDFTRIKGNGEGDTIGNAKLIPLVQSRENGFYILITGGRAYLVSPDGVKMSDGTWSREPFHGTGDDAVVPYSIEVPFDDSDLRMLDWCQSGDTVFFAHRSYPPGKILYSAGELEYERINFRVAQGRQPVIASVTPHGTWGGSGSASKEVEYVVTAVKDGVESAPSVAYAVSYNMPWGQDCGFTITVDSNSVNPDDYDCFYIYKKESDVFGLIGTTSNQTTFLDVSAVFSRSGGSLYPSGYGTFDKPVHLRDSNENRFASVNKVTNTNVNVNTVNFFEYSGNNFNMQAYKVWRGSAQQVKYLLETYVRQNKGTTTNTSTGSTSRSATAQIQSSGSVVFSFGSAGITISKFKIRIGSIEHSINHENRVEKTTIYGITTSKYQYGYAYVWMPTKTSLTSNKWIGQYSEFTASPAKHYVATITFANGDSATANCLSDVDQRVVDTAYWVPVSGSSDRFRHTYQTSDYMYSTNGASEVLNRMEGNLPSVGAVVNFDLESILSARESKTKAITSISISGMRDGVTCDVLVNGLACYQGGKYVYSFTDDYITPDLTITPPKSEDHFLNPGEYPGSVQLYSQRLVYASSEKNPFKFWMSCTGDLYNFDTHEYLRASDAISAETAALEMPRINRMLVHRDLMMFAEGGEWQIAPATGNAITPGTVAAKLQSVVGSAGWLKPIPVGDEIIYCDRSGESLMATKYNFASDGYESSNLSVLSQRLFRNNPIQAMAFAQFPESTLECVLQDGRIASLVYMKEHDVCTWSIHSLGGGWSAKDAATNKSTQNGSSHVAFIAERIETIGNGEGNEAGNRERHWAIFALRDIDPDDDTLLGNLRMDAMRIVETNRTIDGARVDPETTQGEIAIRIGEMREGEGELIRVTKDKWAIGCPFTSVLKTTSPEFSEQETAQMEIKNTTEAEVRVIDGSDFTVRQPEIPNEKATQMAVPCPVDEHDETFTVKPGDADCRMVMTGTNSRNGSVVLEHGGYLPLAILSVTIAYAVEYANHPPRGGEEE